MNPEDVAARPVKPRRPAFDVRWIIAIDGERILIERTGQVLPIERLPMVLLSEPSAILACENASSVLWHLNESMLSEVHGWQYQVIPIKRTVHRTVKRREREVVVNSTVVGFLGWMRDKNSAPGHGRKQNHYHWPLDPTVFDGRPAVELVKGRDKLTALFEWARDVRQWCQDNGLRVNSRRGGLAAQLLKDRRFYPEPRRKVPAATNARVREHLPGNHYQLFVKEGTYHDAFYLDMRAAHHHCARDLDFPDANTLYARGRFKDPPTDASQAPWAKAGTQKFDRVIRTHGLFLLQLTVPVFPLKAGRFPPPFMQKPGRQLAWVHSNEIPTIRELDGIIDGVEVALTSANTESGLNRYAEWALTELAVSTPERRKWLKPTLLAAYGMLAAQPRTFECGFHHSERGEPAKYPTSSGGLRVSRVRARNKVEPATVNVLHRGMIEAEVRARVLRLARELHAAGCHVLCVYADSVVISSDRQPPLLAEPWTIKTPLTRLEFFNPTSFHSVQMTKLPGIPREGLDRISRLKRVRATANHAKVQRSGQRNGRSPRQERGQYGSQDAGRPPGLGRGGRRTVPLAR